MPSKESGLSSEARSELMEVVEKRDAVIRSSCFSRSTVGRSVGARAWETT